MDANISELMDRITRIDEGIQTLLKMGARRAEKEWYTTHEFAEECGRKLYTVREWCRLHRINAEKVPARCGSEQEWRISHEELLRYRRAGLLPLRR